METTEETTSREPMFRISPWVIGIALVLPGLHWVFTTLSIRMREDILWAAALITERAGADIGSYQGYDNPLAYLVPFVGHGLLHAGWSHVIGNTVFFVAFGASVARIMGGVRMFVIYVIAQLGGGIAFLAFNLATSSEEVYAIGASGAVAGMMGSAYYIMAGGRLLSFKFWTLTLLIVVLDYTAAVLAEQVLGQGIAWEAHVGGYFSGVAVCAAFLHVRKRKLEQSLSNL